ncbi:hypothetical protein [Aminobacter sp. Piv2-1]|uniref:hypothetical protein n=1 Tax=Aminobacter sp. Piv2-1 TaxID=3031122 RepID=UPI00309669C1
MQWKLVGERTLPPAEIDIWFVEGDQILRRHLVFERLADLRACVLKQRQAGGLSCDVYGDDGRSFADELRDAIFELHYDTAPVSAGARKSKLTDMRFLRLLPSCHPSSREVSGSLGHCRAGARTHPLKLTARPASFMVKVQQATIRLSNRPSAHDVPGDNVIR